MNFIEKYSLESFPILKSKRIKYFVHSINDLNLIKESLQPILLNTTQFSHGIIDCINHTAPDKQSKAHFLTLSSFGFLLPNKGIHHLIEAIAILNGRGINVRLKLYTSILDHRSSEYYERCMTLIKELNVHDIVEFSTDYLEINDVIRNLSETDLIVLPY